MERVRFSSSPEVFARAQAAFERLRADLAALIPGARIEHVGSTAVPGTLTKGDLDISIVVERGAYEQAKAALARLYELNPGAFASDHSASFKDDAAEPPLGIHLVVAGSGDDFQWVFREVLLARADLRRDYDELKRGFEGKSMAAYREAKEKFFARVKAAPEFLAARAA
ncbi:MAG: GrpB family protein [Elusimicrobia bacterium]|nr:GrpB family protein [Elusimicrobiota bacterium]